MTTITVNSVSYDITNVDPTMPLLWYLRESLGFTGTKFGCGVSMCGACTVIIDGEAIRSCITKLEDVGGDVVTIEGLGAAQLHPVQQAWIDMQVPQCGYCQSGQIMLAATLLASNPNPTLSDIDGYMSENLCRCGTYNEIRAGILKAAQAMGAAGANAPGTTSGATGGSTPSSGTPAGGTPPSGPSTSGSGT